MPALADCQSLRALQRLQQRLLEWAPQMSALAEATKKAQVTPMRKSDQPPAFLGIILNKLTVTSPSGWTSQIRDCSKGMPVYQVALCQQSSADVRLPPNLIQLVKDLLDTDDDDEPAAKQARTM